MRKTFALLAIFLIAFFSTSDCVAGGMETNQKVKSSDFPERLRNNLNVQTGWQKGYIDVTKQPYNATGNGSTDDSAAIRQALDDAYSSNLIAFFPSNKTFLASKQLRCVTTKSGS